MNQIHFVAVSIKNRLLQLASANQLPEQANDFDERLLLPAIVGITYTVSSLTVLLNKKSFTSEYDIMLERPYDAQKHIHNIRTQHYELGLEIEPMGKYMFKATSEKGYTLFTIAPKKDKQQTILNNN